MKSWPAAFVHFNRWLESRQGIMATNLFCGLLALWVRWDFAVEEHPPSHYLVGDMGIYASQAQRIFHIRDAWDTFTPPGYPAFLALIGDIERVGAIQAILGALTTVLTMFIARRLDRSPWVAFIAGLISALYFPLIFYSGVVLSETLFAFLLVSFLGLVVYASSLRSRWIAASAGVVLASAILVRPSLLTFLPFFLAMSWRDKHPHILRFVLTSALITIIPVAMHTSIVLGRPAVVASNGGINFFLAHSECKLVRSTAPGRVISVSTHYTRTHYDRECVIDHSFLDESWFYRMGLTNIVQQPRRLLVALDGLREGLGLVPHRSWPNQPYWPGSTQYDAEINWFSRAYFWLLLLPALLHGFFGQTIRTSNPEVRLVRQLCWVLLASVGIAIYVYNGNPRVRVSSDPIAIVLAASAVVAAGRHLAMKLRRISRRP